MSLGRGEREPDKCPPSSSGFSLGLIPCVKGGDRPQRLPLWRGAFLTVSCCWTEKCKGKHLWPPAPALSPSAVCPGPCDLVPCSPYRWTLLAPGTQALVLGPSPACDGWWSEPRLCKPEDLEVSRCRQGRHESPRCTFLLERTHLDGSGHLPTKMVERGRL